MIDLLSDTLTKPTKEMLEYMFKAEVGDDVFGEDPTVNKLQKMAADMFGMEAALYCSSGTQTNQIAIKVHTQPGDEIICDKLSHIYMYEGGGIAFNSGVSVRLIDGNNGRFTADDIIANINPDNIHQPVTKMVEVENTVNKGGGAYYEFSELEKMSKICKENNLIFHLDGARLFNALVETNETPKDYGKIFDSISICLSKGLGAPVGSLLLGNKAFIKKALRVRKLMGGAMRQAGFIAAAGIYALENNIDRLKVDNDKAKKIGEILQNMTYVKDILPVDTNIIIFKLTDNIKDTTFIEKLKQQNVRASIFGRQTIRMVTHLNFTDEMLVDLEKALNQIK